MVLASQNCSQYIFMGTHQHRCSETEKRNVLLLPSPTLSLHPFSRISWTKPEATRHGSQPKKSISLLDTTPLRSRENRRMSKTGSDSSSPRTGTRGMLPDTLARDWDASRPMSFPPGAQESCSSLSPPSFPYSDHLKVPWNLVEIRKETSASAQVLHSRWCFFLPTLWTSWNPSLFCPLPLFFSERK